MKQLVFCCLEVPSVLLWSLIKVINHTYHRKAILVEAFFFYLSLLEDRLVVSLQFLSLIGIEYKGLFAVSPSYSFAETSNHRILLGKAILSRSVSRHIHGLLLVLFPFLHEGKCFHTASYLVLVAYRIKRTISNKHQVAYQRIFFVGLDSVFEQLYAQCKVNVDFIYLTFCDNLLHDFNASLDTNAID